MERVSKHGWVNEILGNVDVKVPTKIDSGTASGIYLMGMCSGAHIVLDFLRENADKFPNDELDNITYKVMNLTEDYSMWKKLLKEII